LDQIFAQGEDEGSIINIQALEDFNSGETTQKVFLGHVSSYFPVAR
jgi:hypothetical protein